MDNYQDRIFDNKGEIPFQAEYLTLYDIGENNSEFVNKCKFK